MSPNTFSEHPGTFRKILINISYYFNLFRFDLLSGKFFINFVSGFAACTMLFIYILSVIDEERSEKNFIMSVKNLPTYDELTIESVLHFMKIDRSNHDHHQYYPAKSLIFGIEEIKGRGYFHDPKVGGFSSLIEIEDGFLSIDSSGVLSTLLAEDTFFDANEIPDKPAMSSPIKPSPALQSEKLELAALSPPRKPKNVAEKRPKEVSSSPLAQRTTPVTSQIEEFLRGFQVSPVENGFRVVVPGADLFVRNDRNLASDASSILSPIAEVAKLDGGFNLQIVGHTDGIKSADQSMQLSLHRATQVKSLLADMIQNKSLRLQASGQGKETPIASNATLDGRQKNRRIEIFFLK